MNSTRLFTAPRWVLITLLLCAMAVARPTTGHQAQSQAQFKGGVDLVAVDVQVVRDDGRPIPDLAADRFEVSIGGRSRKVVSAQFVSYAAGAAPTGASPNTTGPPQNPTAASAATPPRIYIIAIDCQTFSPGVSRGVVEAVRRFMAQLQSTDLVGVFAFPQGPKLDPTADHATVLKTLDAVQGQRQAPVLGAARLSSSELIDFLAEANARMDITSRLCGGERRGNTITRPPDPGCAAQLTSDAHSLAAFYEGQALMSLSMLGQLFNELIRVEHRKTVVLVSGGMPVSDRPGGRPDVGNLPIEIGHRAARSNASLYTLHIDTAFLERFSAEARAASTSDASRDSNVSLRWLDQFSGTAGGSLMRVLVGNGDTSFARIARETSAYYLLGVAPEPSDRDGKPRELRVRVNERGATVRARRWVF